MEKLRSDPVFTLPASFSSRRTHQIVHLEIFTILAADTGEVTGCVLLSRWTAVCQMNDCPNLAPWRIRQHTQRWSAFTFPVVVSVYLLNRNFFIPCGRRFDKTKTIDDSIDISVLSPPCCGQATFLVALTSSTVRLLHVLFHWPRHFAVFSGGASYQVRVSYHFRGCSYSAVVLLY